MFKMLLNSIDYDQKQVDSTSPVFLSVSDIELHILILGQENI
jgi:hypothetical protein